MKGPVPTPAPVFSLRLVTGRLVALVTRQKVQELKIFLPPHSQVHQRVPLFVGSKGEVEYLESFLNK